MIGSTAGIAFPVLYLRTYHCAFSDGFCRDKGVCEIGVTSDDYFEISRAIAQSTLPEIYEKTARLSEVCAANGLPESERFRRAYLSSGARYPGGAHAHVAPAAADCSQFLLDDYALPFGSVRFVSELRFNHAIGDKLLVRP